MPSEVCGGQPGAPRPRACPSACATRRRPTLCGSTATPWYHGFDARERAVLPLAVLLATGLPSGNKRCVHGDHIRHVQFPLGNEPYPPLVSTDAADLKVVLFSAPSGRLFFEHQGASPT